MELSGTVTQSRRRRFINQTQDIETGKLTRLLGCGTLLKTEVSRDGYNHVVNGITLRLNDILEPGEDQGTDLNGRVDFAVKFISAVSRLANLTLDELNDAVAVRFNVVLSYLPNYDVVLILKEDN